MHLYIGDIIFQFLLYLIPIVLIIVLIIYFHSSKKSNQQIKCIEGIDDNVLEELDSEEKLVKFLWKDGKISDEILKIYEEAPDNKGLVLLEIKLAGKTLSFKSENCFEALEQLRHVLEVRDIQIMCNGAALNVYPSSMALSMGVGRLAYKLFIGKPAKTKDLVDIFDYDGNFSFVSINEQKKFYNDWLNSLGFSQY